MLPADEAFGDLLPVHHPAEARLPAAEAAPFSPPAAGPPADPVGPPSARLLLWLRVRASAVPPRMIDAATRRRAAGDWAGACAAADVDVAFALRAVRHRWGEVLVSRLRTDLRSLAPDLLRWHIPRTGPDGLLRAGTAVTLARYGTSGGRSVRLLAAAPPGLAARPGAAASSSHQIPRHFLLPVP